MSQQRRTDFNKTTTLCTWYTAAISTKHFLINYTLALHSNCAISKTRQFTRFNCFFGVVRTPQRTKQRFIQWESCANQVQNSHVYQSYVKTFRNFTFYGIKNSGIKNANTKICLQHKYSQYFANCKKNLKRTTVKRTYA